MAEGTSAEVQSCRERVDRAVTGMVNQVDKDVFRKMQADMYHCSAKCCENQANSMDNVQNCVQNCQHPVTQAQSYLQKELEDFMERIQRCTMQCQDDVKDRVGPSTPPHEMDKIKATMEKCVIKCGEKHIAFVPGLTKKIKANLQQFK